MREPVVVTDHTFRSLEIEREVLRPLGADIAAYQCRTEEEVVVAVRGARVVLTQSAPLGRRALAALAPDATVIRYGVGVDNIDLRAARELGVAVANVPDYCTEEVADHTVALLLALLRKLRAFDEGVRTSRWEAVGLGDTIPPLRQIVVGIVGLGRIGRAVLQRLQPFGCRVLVSDPFLPHQDAHAAGVEPQDLDSFLPALDALTLHAPLTQKTFRLLNGERLACMKPTAVVVNTARGGLIEAAALAEALHSGRLGGAGLDVFDPEPLPAESPLRGAPNTWLSPHAAWYSDDSMLLRQRLAAEEAARALRGEPLRSPVNGEDEW